jgi:hypothetical protein
MSAGTAMVAFEPYGRKALIAQLANRNPENGINCSGLRGWLIREVKREALK